MEENKLPEYYNPDEALLQLVRTLAASEGLYVWKGTES